MALDIKLIFNEELNEYDIDYGQGDIYTDNTMNTAVIITLLTDRRANDDDVLINKNDKRGWWGDLLNDDGYKIGSRLWLLRGKTDQQTLNQAKEYVKEAMKIFVDDGLWTKFDVMTERVGAVPNFTLGIEIDAYYKNGQKTSYKFKNLWEKQLNITIE